ncbi:MAG: phosphotransferase [Proteobacteria bacterium]|nr:phosphotransferase [Pseudomonadota bacterium]MDA1056634.1 phosphotransferase [Pseudomonadota bacterium]
MSHRTTLDKLTKEWQLELESEPVEAATGLISFVKYKNQPAVLKIASDTEEERTTSVLQHYNGHGAVQILQTKGNTTLMTRATPGKHLKELTLNNEDEKATHILCDVIEKLHSNDDYEGEYRTIADWAKGFDRYIASGDQKIPMAFVNEAKEIFADLAASQAKPILLHGDLHHDNILYDDESGWLAIDPKGVIGEPCYEIGAFLRNPMGGADICASPDIIRQRVDIICGRLGYDRKRVIGWAFVQAILSCVWATEDGHNFDGVIAAAEGFKKQNI